MVCEWTEIRVKVIRMYPPVMDCRILDLNAELNPSLVVALFVKMCNRVSRARASSKCLTERVIASNQMEKWIRPPRFPFFCYPGRHSSSGDGRLEPQKIHDKLPFHGSQKTYSTNQNMCEKVYCIRAYRNMERHEEGR
jgi:hypothetical protein